MEQDDPPFSGSMTDTPPQTPSEMRRQRIRARLGGRSVVLVGMMGAGKSAVGKRLGQELNLPFKDADLEIEAAATHLRILIEK